MKKVLLLLFTVVSINLYGQDIIYNFNTNNESFTQGGMPNYTHNANGYLTSGAATSFTGGFQSLRTPTGLNLSETKYRVVRIVVENSTNNTEWQLMNYQSGSTSGGTAGRTDFTIASVAANSGYTTYDIPITVKTTTPDGKIDRIGIRAKQGSGFSWNAGELKVAQLIIIDTDDWLSNADFETSTNWTASGADVTGGYTTTSPQVGSQAATLTFTQNATTANNYLSNDIYDFGKTVTTSEINTTFYVKSTRAGVNIQIRLRFYDAGGTQVASSFTGKYTIVAANTWETVVLNKSGLTANFNQIQMNLRVQNDGVAAQNGDVISFDQITTNYVPFTTNNSWTGSTDTDWANTSNWTNGSIPTSTENTDIQVSANNPIIGATTGALVNNLEVNSGASLTIASGGTLIVNGTSSGNVTYNRNLGTTNWYLVSSPVSGETMTDMRANNTFDSGTGTNIGFASYNPGLTGAAAWTYFTTTSTDALSDGTGYSAKLSSGDLSFTGTINTENVETSSLSTGFNLIGNPYTSYVSSGTFLGAGTSSNIDQTQIWLWNQALGMYEVKTSGTNWVLAPTQGFFVNATSAGTVTFNETNQAASGNVFQKTTNTGLKLWINDGENNRYAKIDYRDNATKGFDYGWEGETFGGASNSLSIYTTLLENNQGKKYQVQTLPKSDLESIVIPVVVFSETAKEITFTAEALNLPIDYKVFLEDRSNNTLTRLDDANTSYKANVTAGSTEGRFFLHTKTSSVLSLDTEILNSVSIFKTNASTLRINGLPKENVSISLFNLLGKKVMSSSFEANGIKEISLPKLAKGVYFVKLQTAKGKVSKKIILE